MKKKTELGKAVERRYALENPDINVHVHRNCSKSGGTVRKVLATGVVTESAVDCPFDKTELEVLFAWMKTHIRMGHDVKLCDKLHVYGWVNMDMKARCGAKAMGDMCDWLEDKKLKVVTCGEEMPEKNLKDYQNSQKCAHEDFKKGRIAVTPDTVINCPNCGTEIRVGRVLSDRG